MSNRTLEDYNFINVNKINTIFFLFDTCAQTVDMLTNSTYFVHAYSLQHTYHEYNKQNVGRKEKDFKIM